MSIPPAISEGFLRAVTDFVFVQNEPESCDVILVPGSADPQHVLTAAEMYRQGYAPLILPSGRFAIGSAGMPESAGFETEWALMRSMLLKAGVPSSAILREDRAAYTWENAQFSRQATDAAGITIRRAILCCKPYHARRALLYYQAAFPEAKLLVCPADLPSLNRCDWHQTAEGRTMVLGEVRRLGSQINEVLEQMIAYERR